MAKFIARQAVDMRDLDALKFLTDPLNVDFVQRERDGFVAKSGDIRMQVEGSGFRYALEVPLPVGSVTRIAVRESGEPFFKMTGIRIDLDEFTGASNLERLVLEIYGRDDVIKGSAGDDNLIAGNGDDRILGRDGADKLSGQKGRDELDGGKGADTLTGGGGRDVFAFNDSPSSGTDRIMDFQPGDVIRLGVKAFAGLPSGQLPEDRFVDGVAALDGGDRVIFDRVTGALYFDPDGTGAAVQVQIAAVHGSIEDLGATNILVA